MSEKAHWDQVWQSKPAEQTSWFQTAPALSGDFITRAGIAKSDPIIDIGSGASCLIDWMIAARYSNVTALDIAAGGIFKTKKRLGPAGDSLKIIEADIRTWSARERYMLWHDRAVFHFLTREEEQAAYARVLADAVAPGGYFICATFAQDGPLKCSGLPVQRYNIQSLKKRFSVNFQLLDECQQTHITPAGKAQNFQWSFWKRRASPQDKTL